MKKILVPYDGSEHAMRALDQAATLAAGMEVPLSIVHVMLRGEVPEEIRKLSGKAEKPMPEMAVGAAYIEPTLSVDALTEIAEKLLEQAAERSRKNGVEPAEAAWVTGDAATAVLRQAEAVGADLIVMGSRGHGQLGGMLVGSVSQKVQHLFDGSVMVVK